jgi:hypothetical protein
MLAAAAGVDAGGATPALDELERTRWMVADPRGYTFTARIVRDIIASDLVTAARRRQILERAAAHERPADGNFLVPGSSGGLLY